MNAKYIKYEDRKFAKRNTIVRKGIETVENLTFCLIRDSEVDISNVVLVKKSDINKNHNVQVVFVKNPDSEAYIYGNQLEEYNLQIPLDSIYLNKNVYQMRSVRTELFWLVCATESSRLLLTAFNSPLKNIKEKYTYIVELKLKLHQACWRFGGENTIDVILDCIDLGLLELNEMRRNTSAPWKVTELLHAMEGKNTYATIRLLEYLSHLQDKAAVSEYVKRKTNDDKQAIHLVVEMGSTSECNIIIPLLVECGADISATTPQNYNILHLASQYRRSDIFSYVVKFLYKHDSAKLRTLSTRISHHNTVPLVLTNVLEEIQMLIETSGWGEQIPNLIQYNCKKHVYEDSDLSIIHLAARENNFALTNYLKEYFIHYCKLSRNGTEKLFEIVADLNDPDIMCYWIEFAQSMAPNIEYKTLAISDAILQIAKLGKLDLLHKALTYVDLLNYHSKYTYRNTNPIHLVCEKGHDKALLLLLKDKRAKRMGYRHDVINCSGVLPLGVAIQFGNAECVKILLENGAEPNMVYMVNKEGNRRLCEYNDNASVLLAVLRQHESTEILKLLLEYNANPNCQNENKMTPLMHSASKNQVGSLQILLGYSADLLVKDADGNTALHYATKCNHFESVELLCEQMFASVHKLNRNVLMNDLCNAKNVTPLRIAIENNYEQITNHFYEKLPHLEFELEDILDSKGYKLVKSELDEMITLSACDVTISLKRLCPSYDNNEGSFVTFYDSNKYHLLHKLMKCPNERIKYHPVIVAFVNSKVWISQLWAFIALFFHLAVVSMYSYALFIASFECSDLLDYSSDGNWVRALLEVIVTIYTTVVLLGGEIAEGVILWSNTPPYSSREDISLTEILRKYFIIMQYYFLDPLNIADVTNLVAFYAWLGARLSRSELQWSLASISLSMYIMILLKYARILPTLYAYVRSLAIIFVTDLPKLIAILIVFTFAYIGSMHLAARQQFKSTFDVDVLPRDTLIPCSASETVLFWFRPSETINYDLRYPLLSAVLLFVDSGTNNNEFTLQDTNFLFAVTYLFFTTIIYVIMSNILIAQLSETYSEIIKHEDLPFKYEGVIDVQSKFDKTSMISGRFILFAILFVLNRIGLGNLNSNQLFLNREEWDKILDSIRVADSAAQYQLFCSKLKSRKASIEISIRKMNLEIDSLCQEMEHKLATQLITFCTKHKSEIRSKFNNIYPKIKELSYQNLDRT